MKIYKNVKFFNTINDLRKKRREAMECTQFLFVKRNFKYIDEFNQLIESKTIILLYLN